MKRLRMCLHNAGPTLVLAWVLCAIGLIEGPLQGHWAKGTFYVVLAFWSTWAAALVQKDHQR